MTSGVGAHIIPQFEPESMRNVVAVVERALLEDLITAADLMWIASALVKIDQRRVRHVELAPSSNDRFSLFLSHRGSDAEHRLALRCAALPDDSGVFLDCLTLPRGVINCHFIDRHFVYRLLGSPTPS